MMKAIPPMPTIPPKNPSTTAIATASGRRTAIVSASPSRGVTGSKSMTAPANAMTAKMRSSARSDTPCEISAPISDEIALGGPMSQTSGTDTFPYARCRMVPSRLPEIACTMVRPVTIFTGIATPPTSGGR